jgi:Sulfotransferase family
MPSPVLVTGSIRSGTTWAGRMLTLSKQLGYVHEPFNPSRWPGWASERFPHELVYISGANETKYYPIVRDVINVRFPWRQHLEHVREPSHVWRFVRDWQRSVRYRFRRLQPLIKDPDALFSAEWLARRFGLQIVVLVRHPAGFASSIKRLNWSLLPSPWVWQEQLMEDYLPDLAEELHRFKFRTDTDVIDQAILTWKSLYSVVHLYRERHPDWHVVRYEDLADNPPEQLRLLYDQLGLEWDKRVKAGVERYSSSRNDAEVSPSRFRTIKRDSRAAKSTWLTRLSSDEVERVRTGVGDVAKLFYTEDEW